MDKEKALVAKKIKYILQQDPLDPTKDEDEYYDLNQARIDYTTEIADKTYKARNKQAQQDKYDRVLSNAEKKLLTKEELDIYEAYQKKRRKMRERKDGNYDTRDGKSRLINYKNYGDIERINEDQYNRPMGGSRRKKKSLKVCIVSSKKKGGGRKKAPKKKASKKKRR